MHCSPFVFGYLHQHLLEILSCLLCRVWRLWHLIARSSKLNEINVLSITLYNVLAMPWQLLIMMLSWVELFLLLLHVIALLLLTHMVYPRLGHVLILMEFLYLSLFLISWTFDCFLVVLSRQQFEFICVTRQINRVLTSLFDIDLI